MKLLIVILQDGDAGAVMERLIAEGYRVTRIASTGGFLRRGNVTLLIGAEAAEVDGVIDLLRQTCAPPSRASIGRRCLWWKRSTLNRSDAAGPL